MDDPENEQETPAAVRDLIDTARRREPLGTGVEAGRFHADPSVPGEIHYTNTKDRLGIDFSVEKLAFPGLQTMDPRIVRIAPGKTNELHRHAHESIFVVLEGTAEIEVGEARVEVRPGGVAFVPRWQVHRTRNIGPEQLVCLAVTDFGFCSAILGDYDRKHRGKYGGDDTQ